MPKKSRISPDYAEMYDALVSELSVDAQDDMSVLLQKLIDNSNAVRKPKRKRIGNKKTDLYYAPRHARIGEKGAKEIIMILLLNGFLPLENSHAIRLREKKAREWAII